MPNGALYTRKYDPHNMGDEREVLYHSGAIPSVSLFRVINLLSKKFVAKIFQNFAWRLIKVRVAAKTFLDDRILQQLHTRS